MNFKEFLLNEQQAYLGQKVGDILTAVQELQTDAANMGTRDLVRYTQQIINQIRPILHSSWPREEKKFLLVLQKVGFSLAKAIDEKGDLAGKISGSAKVLEKLVADLGVPISKMTPTEPSKRGDSKGTDMSAGAEASAAKVPAEDGPKSANAAAPEQPGSVDAVPQGSPPTPPGQDIYAPGLGGSSGPMDAF
jgi:hypothetical protein